MSVAYFSDRRLKLGLKKRKILRRECFADDFLNEIFFTHPALTANVNENEKLIFIGILL